MKSMALGRHVFLELYDCDASILNQQERIGSVLLEACQKANATVVTHPFNTFSPHGVSSMEMRRGIFKAREKTASQLAPPAWHH